MARSEEVVEVRFVAGIGLVPTRFEPVAIEEVGEELWDPSASRDFEELFEDPFAGGPDGGPPLEGGPLGHEGAAALPEDGFSAVFWEAA